MIKKLLLKYYRKKFREITKISVEEEYKLFLFQRSDDVLKLIRALTTQQVLEHFEKEGEEKVLAKGAALILRMMRDYHIAAMKIKSEIRDPDEQIREWQKFKIRFNK